MYPEAGASGFFILSESGSFLTTTLPSLLSIQNLSIQFSNEKQQTIAVKNSSIEIKKGELLAIVGESGSGKSVTALSLLQLLPGQSTVSGKTLFFQN